VDGGVAFARATALLAIASAPPLNSQLSTVDELDSFVTQTGTQGSWCERIAQHPPFRGAQHQRVASGREGQARGRIVLAAQIDLREALARRKVPEAHLGQTLHRVGTQAPVNHDGQHRSPFLESPFMPERGAYAEETARVIDAEVKRLIETAEAEARRILTDKREILGTLSERLLVKEVIEGEELRQLVSPAPTPPSEQPPVPLPPIDAGQTR